MGGGGGSVKKGAGSVRFTLSGIDPTQAVYYFATPADPEWDIPTACQGYIGGFYNGSVLGCNGADVGGDLLKGWDCPQDPIIPPPNPMPGTVVVPGTSPTGDDAVRAIGGHDGSFSVCTSACPPASSPGALAGSIDTCPSGSSQTPPKPSFGFSMGVANPKPSPSGYSGKGNGMRVSTAGAVKFDVVMDGDVVMSDNFKRSVLAYSPSENLQVDILRMDEGGVPALRQALARDIFLDATSDPNQDKLVLRFYDRSVAFDGTLFPGYGDPAAPIDLTGKKEFTRYEIERAPATGDFAAFAGKSLRVSRYDLSPVLPEDYTTVPTYSLTYQWDYFYQSGDTDGYNGWIVRKSPGGVAPESLEFKARKHVVLGGGVEEFHLLDRLMDGNLAVLRDEITVMNSTGIHRKETRGAGNVLLASEVYTLDSLGHRIATEYLDGSWSRTSEVQVNPNRIERWSARPFKNSAMPATTTPVAANWDARVSHNIEETEVVNDVPVANWSYSYDYIQGAMVGGSVSRRKTVRDESGYAVEITQQCPAALYTTGLFDTPNASGVTTSERYVSGGPERYGKAKSSTSPDGSRTLYVHQTAKYQPYQLFTFSPIPSQVVIENGFGGTLTKQFSTSSGLVQSTFRVSVNDQTGRLVYAAEGMTSTPDTLDGAILFSQKRYLYDSAGNLHQELVRHADGNWRVSSERRYYADRNLHLETDETGVTTTYENYDSHGNARKVTRNELASAGGLEAIPALVTQTSYDALGRRQTERQGPGPGTPTDPIVGSWTYDGLDRPLTETAHGRTTGYGYAIVPGGGTSTTVTNHDQSTVTTTTYRDGSHWQTSGSAAIAETVTPSIQSGQLRITTTRGSGATVATSYVNYNALGQVTSSSDESQILGAQAHLNDGRPYYQWSARTGSAATAYPSNGVVQFRAPSASSPLVSRDTLSQFVQRGDGHWYSLRYDSMSGSQFQQVSGLAASVLSHSIFTDLDGIESHTTVSVDRATGLVTTTSTQAGATNQATRLERAGLVQRENSISVQAFTQYRYDSTGRLYQIEEPTKSAITTFEYHPVFTDQLTKQTTAKDGLTSVSESHFNASTGRLEWSDMNGSRTYVTFTNLGQLHRQWGSSYPVEYGYDTLGRKITMRTFQYEVPANGTDLWSGGSLTTWEYFRGSNEVTKKTDTANRSTEYVFDQYTGRLTDRKLARKVQNTETPVTASYLYDDIGRIIRIGYNDFTTPYKMLFYQDANLVGITMDAQFWFRGYSPAGRLQTDGFYGWYPYLPHDTGRTFENGKLKTLTLKNNAFTPSLDATDTFGYDPQTGRLETITGTGNIYGGGAVNVTYNYTPNSDLVHTVSQGALIRSNEYDGIGRLREVKSQFGNNVLRKVEYHFDSRHRRDEVSRIGETGQNANRWLFEYNNRDEVTRGHRQNLVGNAWEESFLRDFGYTFDPIGNRTKTTTNGRDAFYAPNLLNQYGTVGRPSALDVLGSKTSPGDVQVQWPVGKSGFVTPRGGEFGLTATPEDATGQPLNAQNSAWIDGIKVIGGVGPQNVVTTEERSVWLPRNPETFIYDEDGNLTEDERWIYKWDAENRLIAMETKGSAVMAGAPDLRLAFFYDPYGRRVAKHALKFEGLTQRSFERRTYYYDGWNIVAEWVSGWVDPNLESEVEPYIETSYVQRYVWGQDLSGTLQGAGGVGGLLAMSVYNPDTAQNYLVAPLYDGNGNVLALAQLSDGALKAQYEYGPFGEPLKAIKNELTNNPFRWSTKYTDEETGLVYYGYRYYSSGLGRWLSKDPIAEAGGLNIYSMLGNQPTLGIDYLGCAEVSVDFTRTFTFNAKVLRKVSRDPKQGFAGVAPMEDFSKKSHVEVFGAKFSYTHNAMPRTNPNGPWYLDQAGTPRLEFKASTLGGTPVQARFWKTEGSNIVEAFRTGPAIPSGGACVEAVAYAVPLKIDREAYTMRVTKGITGYGFAIDEDGNVGLQIPPVVPIGLSIAFNPFTTRQDWTLFGASGYDAIIFMLVGADGTTGYGVAPAFRTSRISKIGQRRFRRPGEDFFNLHEYYVEQVTEDEINGWNPRVGVSDFWRPKPGGK